MPPYAAEVAFRPFRMAESYHAGAVQYDEPGVFRSFEERAVDLQESFASSGIDLSALAADKRLSIDYAHVERSEIEKTGEYDLDGFFFRLGLVIDHIGALFTAR